MARTRHEYSLGPIDESLVDRLFAAVGRVVGEERTLFVAPTLILHYVLAHGYRPPAGFIEAVSRGGFVES